eukprot:CAMPEP_0197274974 /NCGR_PEP_ID=MMETSP1432-20130617/13361_1 /TAXON_ID=44447 /ORGANISM="Pseudo-nitzschia delicatissima, Strain UNC1205" /LENGTH=78 /DNA_ID=CAMNT_0042740837 /DNA_START=49 /DNA_END=282 /DNA_ORIENTATION=+
MIFAPAKSSLLSPPIFSFFPDAFLDPAADSLSLSDSSLELLEELLEDELEEEELSEDDEDAPSSSLSSCWIALGRAFA